MTGNFRIAIVVQQCGTEVLAGAERYALNLGLALANLGCDVKVLTTQSANYQTWENTLPSTEMVSSASLKGAEIEILRFANQSGRKKILQKIVKLMWRLEKSLTLNRLPRFSLFLDKLFLWSQGPWCPSLWRELSRSAGCFDLIIFKSYLYAPTFYGTLASINAKKTMLIPAAHPEEAFCRPFVGRLLENISALGFVSKAEQELVESVWPFTNRKVSFLLPPGLGNEWLMAKEDGNANELVRDEIQQLKDYFLVLGRMDRGKNLELIFRNTPASSKVVFAGSGEYFGPKDDRFVVLGKVSEAEKKILLQNALALLSVSKNEAFSMTTAEAVAEGCPVIGWSESKAVCELIERFGGAQFQTGEELALLLEGFKYGSPLRSSTLPRSKMANNELTWQRTGKSILDWIAGS